MPSSPALDYLSQGEWSMAHDCNRKPSSSRETVWISVGRAIESLPDLNSYLQQTIQNNSNQVLENIRNRYSELSSKVLQNITRSFILSDLRLSFRAVSCVLGMSRKTTAELFISRAALDQSCH